MADPRALINRTGMFIDQVSETNPVISVNIKNNQITEVDNKVVIRNETKTIDTGTWTGDIDGGDF